MKKLTYLLFITLALAAFTFAQTPVSPEKPTQAPRSITTLDAKDKFTSTEGRFTVSLPEDPVRTEHSNRTAGNVSFLWQFKEGKIVVLYGDGVEFPLITENDYDDLATFLKMGIEEAVQPITFLSGRRVRLGKYRGYEVTFNSSKEKAMERMLIDGKRKYVLFCMTLKDAPAAEYQLLLKALESFQVIPPKPLK